MISIFKKAALLVACAICTLPALAVVNDIDLKNIVPKAGELDIEIRSLEQITLTFNQDVNVRENTLAYLTTPDGKELTFVMQRNQYLKNTVLIGFPDINYFNGDYTLTIKRWSVGDDEWFEDYEQGHSNAEIKVVWTINNGLPPGADYDLQPVSVLPANNTSFTYPAKPLTAIQITMPEGSVMNPKVQASLSCVKARYASTLTFIAENKGRNIIYTADVSPTPSVMGDYTLVFPAGMFGNEQYIAEQKGYASPTITMLYSVSPSDEESTGDEETVDWSMRPLAAKLEATGNDYLLTWRWSGNPNVNSEALSDWCVIDPRGYKVPDIAFTFADPEAPAAVVKFTAELQPDGQYVLLVPQAMFHDETYTTLEGKLGTASPQLRYDFVPEDITCGVTAAVAGEKPAKRSVYTSQGIRLYDNATEDQLRTLPASLYIIAGKEVLVRQ